MLPTSPARAYAEQGIDLNQVLIEHPHATFFMYAETMAMIDAYIPPGALLVIDRAKQVQNGDIVVAVVNGDYTVRYLRRNEHTSWLYPANKKFREIKVTPQMNMTVWGVVVQVIINPRYVAAGQ